MGAVRQKLKSKRGASIVLALIFFLVCAAIGGIVLASAASNAGRLSHIRQEQQAYLTASSAAKLVRDELAGIGFTGEYIKTTTSTSDSTTPTEATSDVFTPAIAPTKGGTDLTDWVGGVAEDIYKYLNDTTGTIPDPALTKANTTSFKISSNAAQIEAVKVDITMSTAANDAYSISAIISFDNGDVRYEMKLKIPATMGTIESGTGPLDTNDSAGVITSVTTKTKTTTITYGTATITKGSV